MNFLLTFFLVNLVKREAFHGMRSVLKELPHTLMNLTMLIDFLVFKV